MFTRILSALTWPARKLIGLERQGRVVGSLAIVDAVGLGLWLFALNGFVFNRALDQDDYSTLMVVPVLCYAACRQYGLKPGRPASHWLPGILAGEALAATILCGVFAKLGMDLDTRQILLYFGLHLPLHAAVRAAYLLARKRLPHAPLEVSRLMLVGGGAFALISAFATRALIGSGDAFWYSIVVHDFVAQWRSGIFPVFVGQTEWAFPGTVNPLRFAPYLQHVTGMLDLLTVRTLPFVALLNLAIVLSVIGGAMAAYFCCATILPRNRWAAAALALLYAACPGVLGLAYNGNLFMTVMVLPYVPLLVHALWLSLRPDDLNGAVGTALPLAVIWWCHAPVALWLTFLAIGIHLVRLTRRWRESRIYRDYAKGAAFFLLGAGYVFVSVMLIHPPTQVVDRGLILDGLRSAFPADLLPLSDAGLAHGDAQLGWSLWAVLLFAGVACCWTPRRSLGPLALGAGCFTLLLMPIPGINRWLWRLVPQTVCNITFFNADQRIYVIIAGLAVIAGAAAMAGTAARRPRFTSGLTLLLAVGVAWSSFEASNFIEQVFNFRPTPAQTDAQEALQNVVLTRYSFNPFATVPSYFSHGYVDPYLENRVWTPDQKGILFDNAAAVRPADRAPAIATRISAEARGTLELDPPLELTGGVRYAVRFEPSAPLAAGSLIADGESVFREYVLPDSGLGMPYTTPPRAFGFLPTSRDFFPIWTPRPGVDRAHLRYVFRDADAVVAANRVSVRIRVRAYDPGRLPVRIGRWAPYQATVESPTVGAWLETPRLFTPGYRATVNGRTALIGRSADGRVLVSLAAGSNRIVLSYPGPWLLRASYYAALITWILLGLRAVATSLTARPPGYQRYV